jgi:hypothetical protein
MLQAQVSKTVNITAGGLASALTASEKSTITNLTITGTIDARDFKTMRDNMDILKVIDIEAVSIVAYHGAEGTESTVENYLANSIPNYAYFYQSTRQGKTSLTSFVLPTSVTSIEHCAFSGCSNLGSVSIPPLVTYIGGSSFSACSNLISINIPSLVVRIEGYAFYQCENLMSVIIPSSVTSIGEGAFSDCSSLTSVTIPPSVKSIDAWTFINCKNLTSVTIPPSVTSIGKGAFSECSSLTSLIIPSSVKSIEDFTFADCLSLKSVNIPQLVTSIGNSAFYGCRSLNSINIPSTVTSIGSSAFSGCESLKSLTIPQSAIFIGSYAFSGCRNMDFINIPSLVTAIELGTFASCEGLKSITIPLSVISIGTYAFFGCENFDYINVYNKVPIDLSLSTSVFYFVDKENCILSVPFGSKALYQVADQWKDFTHIVEMPGFSLSDTTITIPYKGSTDSIVINSNATWAVASDQQWLTVSAASGTGNDSLIFTAVANQSSIPRTALVTVSAEGALDQTITVLQEANLALLTVDENYLNIGADEGSMASVKVTSNITWNVTSNQSWLIPGSALGTGNDTLIFTAKANPSTILRFATVTISAEGVANQIITVLQEAAAATLTVLEKNVSIGPDEGSTASAIVTSNTNWTTTSNQQWLTINSATGTGNGTLIFTANANPSIIPRVATVTVSTEGLTPQTITITQEAVYTSSTLLVSPTLVIIAADEGSTASVIIAAKLPWTATSSETWLTKTPGNGIGNDTLVFTSKANLSSYDRPARVIITATDASVQTITVIQLAKFELSVFDIPKENITLFPNPVTDGFRINGVEGKAEITISDLSGKLLLSKEIEGNEYVSATSLVKGVYIVRITNVQGRVEKRLIKE